MKKGIITVFIILGILVLGVIIWALVFNGGVLENAINAIVTPINNIFGNMTGEGDALIEDNNSGAGLAVNGDNNLKDAQDNAGWGTGTP